MAILANDSIGLASVWLGFYLQVFEGFGSSKRLLAWKVVKCVWRISQHKSKIATGLFMKTTITLLLLGICAGLANAQTPSLDQKSEQAKSQVEEGQIEEGQVEEGQPRLASSASVLDKHQWERVDASVERALAWLATKQQDDGSFESIALGQPAVTSFCVMAFLSQGESPSGGKYQQQLSKAIDFIVDQQKPNGLIATIAPPGSPIQRRPDTTLHQETGVTAVYNHTISALALCEAYGQCSPEQSKKIAPVIEKAIAATIEMQGWDNKRAKEDGGWRYLDKRHPEDSDLSITGRQLMFLRSAKNTGFDVPEEIIDKAGGFVEACFNKRLGVHSYVVAYPKSVTRAMAGAGVLALAHSGKHSSKEAMASGEWILKHDFSKYNEDKPTYNLGWQRDRYHYGMILCTQAMYQLGGKYWKQFFPPLVETLLANQKDDGSWPPESWDKVYGNSYTTSLCILSLSVPNQMLPIFQR